MGAGLSWEQGSDSGAGLSFRRGLSWEQGSAGSGTQLQEQGSAMGAGLSWEQGSASGAGLSIVSEMLRETDVTAQI